MHIFEFVQINLNLVCVVVGEIQCVLKKFPDVESKFIFTY